MMPLRFVGAVCVPPHPQPFSPCDESEHDSLSSQGEKGASIK
ncbi:hypothetical protein Enr13x_38360 [Stieleria neptunia]|uniref:Uncharacterized protein n=1 Tax=Stieleria neptunia TaxID=2527979 RepID=A0A518HSZ5_9BACT|nr:hypothetical protein Enr13x_38360 [Stieleria neptunia]